MQTLLECGVSAHANILLIVRLCSIGSNLKHVVFNLNYKFHTFNYIDGSVFMYNGARFARLVDWIQGSCAFITHSSDIMDRARGTGHQLINIYMDKIPPEITCFYFALSAWSNPNLSHYYAKSIQCYDASNQSKPLCSTDVFGHSTYSRAVVMCSMRRNVEGTWEVLYSGKLSDGAASNYPPLRRTVDELARKGI